MAELESHRAAAPPVTGDSTTDHCVPSGSVSAGVFGAPAARTAFEFR